MVTNRMKQNNPLTGKGWARRLIGLFVVLFFGGLVCIILVAIGIVPGKMRSEVERRLSDLSEGTVQIKDIRTNYSGQIVVEDVRFFTDAKRPWLMADTITINLADWPGLHATIDAIEIDGLNVRLYTTDDKVHLPKVNWPEHLDRFASHPR